MDAEPPSSFGSRCAITFVMNSAEAFGERSLFGLLKSTLWTPKRSLHRENSLILFALLYHNPPYVYPLIHSKLSIKLQNVNPFTLQPSMTKAVWTSFK
jgi:hypothetical protein